jgi:hypothetical protein
MEFDCEIRVVLIFQLALKMIQLCAKYLCKNESK